MGAKRLLSRSATATGLRSGKGVSGLDESLARKLEALLEGLRPAVGARVVASDAARALVAVTALLLAGAETRKRSAVQVSVVFGRDGAMDQGAAGFLELREFPAGPIGLFPDPQAMAGASSIGPGFVNPFSRRESSPWRSRGRCVLWRITLAEDPVLIPPLGGSLALLSRSGCGNCSDTRSPTARRSCGCAVRSTACGRGPR